MFARVLIANRGEIAVRIARTLRRLGIESIAVFSDADAGAPHVRAADRAVRLGPAPAAESYLDGERVIAAALGSGAEAIHPGYGFLSERPDFARACVEAGLVFIGPSPKAMALLGDKVAAKEAAAAAGVPVVPGLSAAALSDEQIIAWAAGQELPLLLKAAAGGGGKGMRVVSALDDLPEALGAARREARAAFGDDRLLVERYLQRSRHIEVQVIADEHGAVLHLGERECSLQRRHQKVIEEAPSPVVDAELRERMGTAAVELARSCGYTGAGTVELIAEADEGGRVESFFFLEMNARLQVEHPVTEAVTGLDLVELQLRVAAGEPLGLLQDDIALHGHAVEARLYAEDPAHGFLPSTGRVVAYREPAEAVAGGAAPLSTTRTPATTIRIDSGVAEGVEVGSDYDPMLAKVIAHAPDRAGALAQLDRALGDLVVLGPTTNGAYLRALLARPEVQAGALDTGLIERLAGAIAPPVPDPALPAAALAILLGPPATDDPWDAHDAWRVSGPAWTQARLQSGDEEVDVALRAGRPPGDHGDPAAPSAGARHWEWRAGDATGTFHLDDSRLTIEGRSRPVSIHHDGNAIWLLDGASEPTRFTFADKDRAAAHATAGGSLEAPMPGTVIDIRAEQGDAVEEGDVLIVIESMKMELAVQSPGDGTVEAVLVTTGDRVTRGQVLVVLEAADADRAAAPPVEPVVVGVAVSRRSPPETPTPATGPARSPAANPAEPSPTP